MAKAKYEDARLLLQLYDLRREALMRRARQWYMTQFNAYNWEEYQRKYPKGSEEERMVRMVTSYWNMAASIVRSGAIEETLFFQNSGEMLVVWDKAKPWVEGMRLEVRPSYLRTLEAVAEDYRAWSNKMNQKYAVKRRRTPPAAVSTSVSGDQSISTSAPAENRKRSRPSKKHDRGRLKKRK
ncbi:MAG: hypothetical protein ACE14V_02650 [bacterium]